MKITFFFVFLLFFVQVSHGETSKVLYKSESYAQHSKTVHVLNCGLIRNKSKYLHTSDKSKIAGDLFRFFVTGSSIYKSNPCLLIKNRDKYMLWETGIPDEVEELGAIGYGKEKPNATSRFIRWGTPKFFRFYVTENYGLEGQLAALGVTPEDIDFVALSHFHYDHAGNVMKFKNAKILVQKKELEALNEKESAKNYHYDHNILEGIRAQITAIDSSEFDVFGDQSVKLIGAPGHTPGHQILKLNMDIGVRILSGDLFASVDSYKNATEFSIEAPPVPYFNSDRSQTMGSYKKVQGILKETQGKIWIQHAKETYLQSAEFFPSESNPLSGEKFLESVFMGTSHFYKLK